MFLPITKKCCWLITGVIVIVVLALGLGLGLGLRNSQVATTKRGAVTSVARECAQIGTDILKMDGSAADAAIATLFCDGAATMQSMGLGGGFLMTIYTKETGKAESLDAREAAPAAAHKDMFENITIVTGPLSIAIPAELKGYGALYNRYGRLPWRTLIQPTINLCRNGFELSAVLDRVIHLPTYDVMIKTNPEYRDIFVNPQTGELYVKGDIIRRPKLAATLELIAEEGPATLYTANGTMAKLLIDEIQNLGGILTIQDLVDYSVQWQDSNTARVFNDKRIYSSPLPGSGSVLIFIMNLLDGFLPNEESVTFFHRMIESFKFGFAMRTKLGDPIFEPTAAEFVKKLTDPQYATEIRAQILENQTSQNYTYYGADYSNVEDHGTAHISVLAPNGDAVSITSTVNTYFGSKILSASTGIILNDQMDDFSTPGVTNAYGLEASPMNYIAPGKRPLSSMCPTIIVNGDGVVEMIIGAAGGSKITTSVASIIIRHLFLNESLPDAIASRRLHHQLAPMQIEYEEYFPADILNGLTAIGHVVHQISPDGFSAATAISNVNNIIVAVSDQRRNGTVSVF